jgi:hypothetical protein
MTIGDMELNFPDVHRRTLQRDLKVLFDKQLIAEIGSSATDPNRSYRLHPGLKL